MTHGYHEHTDTSADEARRERRARWHEYWMRYSSGSRGLFRWRAAAVALFFIGLAIFEVVREPDRVEVPDETATAAQSVERIDAGLRDVLARVTDPGLRFVQEYSKTDDPGGCGAYVGTTEGWGMVRPEVRYTAFVPGATADDAQRILDGLRRVFIDARIEVPPNILRSSVHGTRDGIAYGAEHRMQTGGALFALEGTGRCVWPDGVRP